MPEEIKIPNEALNRIVKQATDAINGRHIPGDAGTRGVLVQAIAMALREAREFLVQQADRDCGNKLLTTREIAALDSLAGLRREINGLPGTKAMTNDWLNQVEDELLSGPGRRQWQLLRPPKEIPE